MLLATGTTEAVGIQIASQLYHPTVPTSLYVQRGDRSINPNLALRRVVD